jgi:hypothetical protein
MTRVPRKNFAVHLGCLFAVAGLLVSGSLLEATIFPAGTIVGTGRRAAALLAGRIVLVALGTFLLAVRPRISVVHVSALALAVAFGGLVSAVLLQVAYVPPPILSGWKAFAPPAEQNQLGYRGRPIAYAPNDYVIVLVGDSQVEAMALAFEAMPERVLESHLDIAGRKARVFSLGAGGYGQDQEMLALQGYFATYRADLVVLWQTPTNDIWNNLFNTHMGGRNPKPTFWLDGSGGLQGPREPLGQSLANSRVVVAALFQRAFGLPWRDKRWERQLPEPYIPIDHYNGQVRTEWQERWRTNLGRMRDEELDTEKSHMAVLFTPRSRRMQYGLDLTRALVHRIRDLVTANHGRLVILQVDTGAGDGEGVYVLNGKFYRVSKRQALANWDYVNQGFDTVIVPVTVPAWRIAAEDAHLNKMATEQVMIDLANRLRSRIGE